MHLEDIAAEANVIADSLKHYGSLPIDGGSEGMRRGRELQKIAKAIDGLGTRLFMAAGEAVAPCKPTTPFGRRASG